MINKVHLINKTHLDIGFTDYASKVVENYMDNYIPRAIDIAYELNHDGETPRFVWTTGSWLIWKYLNTQSSDKVSQLEKAIQDGYIKWHGLPFTTHTELMDEALFQHGLSYSKELDERFDCTTIAAKMTDVPGHTIGIIKYLAKYGIKYLHIGVNPASKNPDVPKLFVWRDQAGNEVIVNYADNYGRVLEVEGVDEALSFAHTGDNCGPGDVDGITKEINNLKSIYKDAQICGSTLDAFGKILWDIKSTLPVVTEEIGDTWIHGIATDPTKVTKYRKLLKLKSKWLKEGMIHKQDKEYKEFMDYLIMVPEHTWGMDLKKHLPDYLNYKKQDFNNAKQLDNLKSDYLIDKYSFVGSFAVDDKDNISSELFKSRIEDKSYTKFIASWDEQREYIDKAVEALSEPLCSEAKEMLDISNEREMVDGKSISPYIQYTLGGCCVMFASDGSILNLIDSSKRVIADETSPIGKYIYEKIGTKDYEYWFNTYMSIKDTYTWSISDFSKPGLELLDEKICNKKFSAFYKEMSVDRQKDKDVVVIELDMPDEAWRDNGAPRRLVLTYYFYYDNRIDINLKWFNKDENRMPEASWFQIAPKVGNKYLYRIEKLGTYVSPYNVVHNGGRNLHAVGKNIIYSGADGSYTITPHHTPLVSMGDMKILRFDNKIADMDNGCYFNIHNNIWGTNFPMWFGDDISIDYSIEF